MHVVQSIRIAFDTKLLDTTFIDAVAQRISGYTVEIWNAQNWMEIDSGFGMGRSYTINLGTTYTETSARINMTSRFASGASTYVLYKVEVYNR